MERPHHLNIAEQKAGSKVTGLAIVIAIHVVAIMGLAIALNQGARPLVDMRSSDRMAIVIQEIMQDKIYLDLAGNVRARQEGEDGMGDGSETVDLTQPEG